MNYNLLNDIGLGNMDLTYLFIGAFTTILILLIVVIVLCVNLGRLSKKYKKFMGGKNAKSLEKDIMGLYEDNRLIKASMEKNRKDIENLYRKQEGAFQKIGIIKYDAFNQMGGQLSYSLALLDENDNGFIINSVHSTEGCYSYSKEVRNGDNSITLSAEEAEALAIAKGKVM